jgi:hypothetical protein
MRRVIGSGIIGLIMVLLGYPMWVAGVFSLDNTYLTLGFILLWNLIL